MGGEGILTMRCIGPPVELEDSQGGVNMGLLGNGW